MKTVALNDSPESFKIHFLLGEPKRSENQEAFVRACHLLERIPAPKRLVRENELESFAESVANEITSHLVDNP
jgi:hypothetical protein